MNRPVNQADQLQERTKAFAVRIVHMFRKLPKTYEARTIGRQLLRSGTSVAANYRATRRARSKAEFISRLGVVVEESDETVFWLEMLVDSGIIAKRRMESILTEAKGLRAIFATSRATARKR